MTTGNSLTVNQPHRSVPTTDVGRLTAPFLVAIFIFSLIPPIYFYIGGIRLNPTRIILIITFFPLLWKLFSGSSGKLRVADLLLLSFSIWMFALILLHMGISRFPLAAMSVIEMLGGYLVGRVLIRNEADYRFFYRMIVLTLLILFPFAVYEYFTGVNFLQKIFSTIFQTYQKPNSLTQTWRNGYARVMSGFEHPILYGVFCSTLVAPIFFCYKNRPAVALSAAALPALMAYLSLSSAPVIAVAICLSLMLWGAITKNSWKFLIWMFISIWIFLSIASNRGPILIAIDKLTFDTHTAWTRVWTWHYGSAEVLRHPILGMGLEFVWQRPSWLTESVDNFWLVIAMRYGLPGIGLLIAAFSAGIWVIVRNKNLPDAYRSWRTGYIISLVGLYFTLTTVHIWGNLSSFVMMLIGSGMWFSYAASKNEEDGATVQSSVRRIGNSHLTPAVLKTGNSRPADLPTTRFAFRDRRSRPDG